MVFAGRAAETKENNGYPSKLQTSTRKPVHVREQGKLKRPVGEDLNEFNDWKVLAS